MAFWNVLVSPSLFTAEQACRMHFVMYTIFLFVVVGVGWGCRLLSICVNIYGFCIYIFLKTPNGHGTQFRADKMSKFIMPPSSRPIPAWNDVRKLLLLFTMLGLCLLFLLCFFQMYLPTQSIPSYPRICGSHRKQLAQVAGGGQRPSPLWVT